MHIESVPQAMSLAPHHLLLVLYSITDRSSFLKASTMLKKIDMMNTKQVMLLGNKMDLHHLREVSATEHTYKK